MQKRTSKLVFAFVFVNAVLISGILLVGITKGFRIDREKTSQQSQLILKVILEQQKNLENEAKLVLQSWAKEITLAGATAKTACDLGLMEQLEGDNEKFYLYGVVDMEGNVQCSSSGFEGAVNVSERKYVQDAFAKKTFVSGEFQVGKITGQPSINFAYPVLDAQGDVEMILVLPLNLEWANEFVSNFDFPDGTKIVVTDADGSILISYPHNPKLIGTSEFDAKTFSLILAGKSGTIETVGTDGIDRIYTYSPFYLEDTNTPSSFIVVGLPKAEVYGNTNKLIIEIASLLGGLIIFEFIVAAKLFKRSATEGMPLI